MAQPPEFASVIYVPTTGNSVAVFSQPLTGGAGVNARWNLVINSVPQAPLLVLPAAGNLLINVTAGQTATPNDTLEYLGPGDEFLGSQNLNLPPFGPVPFTT